MPDRSRSATRACSPPARSPPESCSRSSARRSGSRCPPPPRSGALLGLMFGLPSLRLRGLYLAVSTLALHFIVIYPRQRVRDQARLLHRHRDRRRPLGSARAAGTSRCSPPPRPRCSSRLNLLRSRTGRAWRAIHGREAVAEALGISVQRAKLSAFVVSSTLTAVAGCLFAYYRGFVSAEAFSLYLTIQYVAMVIIGGMGSILGAVLGTVFVVLFPYAIDGGMALLGLSERLASVVFAVNYAAFGLVMILFLVFEPQGLVGIWRRMQNWFLLWPFKQRPLAADDAAAQAGQGRGRRTTASSPRCKACRSRCRKARSSRCSAPTAPARRRPCAPSRDSSAWTTPASPTARSRYRGERIENRPPHHITVARHRPRPRAQQGVREPHRRREPGGGGAARGAARASARSCLRAFPGARRACNAARPATCPAASGRCSASAAR